MSIGLSSNITELRKKKGITQDELADFLGVTKASVSKWETGQCYPDILLLPQIASYFNITIDCLIGYEPQMSSEQIEKCYEQLSKGFASKPFYNVWEESRALVKKYYSCYELLEHIVILWINHFMLEQDKEKQQSLLYEIDKLCDHIYKNCKDVGICSETIAFKAIVNLQLGKPKEVIDALEPIINTRRIMMNPSQILIQAYQMSGNITKAEIFSQVSIYINLFELIGNSIGIIALKIQDYDYCMETIKRIQRIIDTYKIDELSPNTSLQFHYNAAVCYSFHNMEESAINELEFFVEKGLDFIKKGIEIHGDEYFTKISEWFQLINIGRTPPRNVKLILESLLPAIENPVFSRLYENKAYIKLKEKIKRAIKEEKKQ